MKKVLVIITTEMRSYGGLATVALNYYRKIDKEKIKMDFLSTNNISNDLRGEFVHNNSEYFMLKGRNSNPIKYFRLLTSICKGYDIVHIHSNSATATVELLAAKIAKVPKRIIHIHNTTCTHIIAHKLLKPIFMRCYTDAIACSRKAGEWIFEDKKFCVLNNAIDLEKYSYNIEDRKNIRGKYSLAEQFIIGHVGKMVEQKNHMFILNVFEIILQKCSDARLILVGDGELFDKIKQSAEEKGIANNIIFCGMVDNAKMYYSAFDCMIFPSLWEGLPLSLLEAQASGLSCVSSDLVTEEVNMGGVIRLSLESQIEKWADTVLEKKTDEKNRIKNQLMFQKIMKNKGFDIKTNVINLEKIYLRD